MRRNTFVVLEIRDMVLVRDRMVVVMVASGGALPLPGGRAVRIAAPIVAHKFNLL
jgi:hypothetical protein